MYEISGSSASMGWNHLFPVAFPRHREKARDVEHHEVVNKSRGIDLIELRSENNNEIRQQWAVKHVNVSK